MHIYKNNIRYELQIERMENNTESLFYLEQGFRVEIFFNTRIGRVVPSLELTTTRFIYIESYTRNSNTIVAEVLFVNQNEYVSQEIAFSHVRRRHIGRNDLFQFEFPFLITNDCISHQNNIYSFEHLFCQMIYFGRLQV